jgi:hypothetical protein
MCAVYWLRILSGFNAQTSLRKGNKNGPNSLRLHHFGFCHFAPHRAPFGGLRWSPSIARISPRVAPGITQCQSVKLTLITKSACFCKTLLAICGKPNKSPSGKSLNCRPRGFEMPQEKLHEVIHPDWLAAFAARGELPGAGFLDWETDSHCGAEVLRVLRLAEFVCHEWVDVQPSIMASAVAQCCVICNG